ncbi:hypothetical protein CXB51_003740 [Gossypium anomalum]|uniref:Uncharacterized protein n=1 Tax=Gossypium anomalum TaxID=47600 RepID=A0A8J6A0W4_9ROSI|nr:hypothetical protein CXB51_003740 [Gossypium anomalum]
MSQGRESGTSAPVGGNEGSFVAGGPRVYVIQSVPPRAISVHIQVRNNCYIYVGQLISSQGTGVFLPGEDHRHVGTEKVRDLLALLVIISQHHNWKLMKTKELNSLGWTFITKSMKVKDVINSLAQTTESVKMKELNSLAESFITK